MALYVLASGMSYLKRMPDGEKEALLRAQLAFKDFLDCAEIRRTSLIDNYSHFFKDKRVLELGAHVGIFSQSLLDYSKEVVLIENNPRCVQLLKKKFGKNVQIIEEDVHHELWKFKPESFDVIVCAGILYHSAYPYFMLEGIAHLKPSKLLLDTLVSRTGDIELRLMHPVNIQNFRFNHRPDSGAAIRLGPEAIDPALINLGFSSPIAIDKSSLSIEPESDSKYFQEWKSSYSKWWQKA